MEYYDSIEAATQAEYELPEGVYQIRFWLSQPASPGDIAWIKSTLSEAGIEVKEVITGIEFDMDYIAVTYMRTVPDGGISFLPVAIIPLIGLGIVATLIGIGIFKWEEIIGGLIKFTLVAGGVLIALALIAKKPAMAYLEKK